MLFFVAVLSNAVLSSVVLAGDWQEKSFSHYSNDESLYSILQAFSLSVGVPVEVSPEVVGIISGQFNPMPGLKFITGLSNMNGLIWYYDGRRIFVTNASEMQQKRFRANKSLYQNVIRSLKDVNMYDKQYELVYLSYSQEIVVSAPPRYIDIIGDTVAGLKLNSYEKLYAEDVKTVRVFYLKYALAVDRVSNFRGENVVLKGVASIVTEIMAGKADKGMLKNLQMDEGMKRRVESIEDKVEYAKVVANRRLNSVIVNDVKSKMPLYEMLIESLDQPMQQVNIEVSIVDISTNRLRELGIDWSVKNSSGEIGIGDVSSSITDRSSNDIALSFGDGVNLNNAITNNVDAVLTRIRMLSTEGDANVLSQPSILTFDNLEAVIDHSTTFYVRLTGEREVDLFPVTVGLVLKVTPHIIEENDKRKIHLTIDIEDGKPTENVVDNIPTVTKSVINTQALVYEGSSLVVGGYYFDTVSKSVAMVPLLGRIPIIGALFRKNVSEVKRMSRLFLITPTIKSEQELYSYSKQDLLNESSSNFKGLSK